MAKRIFFLILCSVLLFFSFKLTDSGSEAERFYRSFVDKNELSKNENGELLYTDKNYADKIYTDDRGICKLKYADVLSFDELKRVNIEVTDVAGGALNYNITNISKGLFKGSAEDDLILLKYMDGAWYEIKFSIAAGDFTTIGDLSPNETQNKRHYLVFGNHYGYRSEEQRYIYLYSLLSAHYALFCPVLPVREKDGALIAVGGGMVEFDLINDNEAKRYEMPRGTILPELAGTLSYRVENVGETIYFDPYNFSVR